MIKTHRHSPYRNFLIINVFILLAGIIPFFLLEKGEMVYLVNARAGETLDIIFRYITWIGSGWLFAALVLVLLFVRMYYALAGGASLALTGLSIGFFKYIVFPEMYRPTHIFGLESFEHLLRDFEYRVDHSFPSGHTITVYAFAAFLVYVLPRKWSPWVFTIMAVLVGFSRIYLLQHFYMDVYAGAAVGIAVTTLTVWFFERKSKLKHHPRMQQSAYQLFP